MGNRANVTVMVKRDEPIERALRRFSLALVSDGEPNRSDPKVTIAGDRVVYEQGGELWVHDLDQLEPRRIEGSIW